MGIGKSRTFIEAVKLRQANRVLVICPACAVLGLEARNRPLEPQRVVSASPRPLRTSAVPQTYTIVTHGLMSQKNGAIPEALVKGKAFEMTALDEAHAFNAPDTNRVKALAKPRGPSSWVTSRRLAAPRCATMPGTSITCWRSATRAFRMTRHDYEETFCHVVHKTFGGSRMIRVIEGSKNLDKLKTLIAPFMMRVRKEDVFADLPAILWDTVPVPLDHSMMLPPDLDRLESVVGKLLGDTSHHRRSADMPPHSIGLMELRRMLGAAKLRGATEYIVDMLDNLPHNRKILVFAHHSHVIAALARHLGEYSPAVLVGTTKPADREIAVDKFLTDPHCRVFIGNIQAAGTAITLVGPKCKCSDVIFVESSWTPMDNAQAACRVHRIGQKDGVVARMLSAAGTVDDLINGLLVRKAREFTQLFDNKETT